MDLLQSPACLCVWIKASRRIHSVRVATSILVCEGHPSAQFRLCWPTSPSEEISLAPCSYLRMVNLSLAQSWLISCGKFSPPRGLKAIFSCHSFRIGAAMVAAHNGIPNHLIQVLGRWTSNAYHLYICTPSEAIAGISSQLAWHGVSLPFVIHSSFNIAVELSTELPWACTVVFGVALTVSCIHLVIVLSVFWCNCCAWCLGLLESEVPFHPCSLAPPFSSTKEIPVWWGPLAGLRIPPHARALPGSTNFVGNNAQAHLLVMSLNVAKCNLGKVNLEAMLVSSFPSYTRGGPMPLAGAPCDLYMQLLACSSSQSVIAIACCLRAILCFGFFPIPPSLRLEVWAR